MCKSKYLCLIKQKATEGGGLGHIFKPCGAGQKGAGAEVMRNLIFYRIQVLL